MATNLILTVNPRKIMETGSGEGSSDLHLRNGTAAFRAGLSRSLASTPLARRALRGYLPSALSSRSGGWSGADCVPPSYAYGDPAGGSADSKGPRRKAGGSHLLLWIVRAAERDLPAVARCKDDPGRRVRTVPRGCG